MVSEKGTFLESLSSASVPAEARIERLFLSILSRKPSDEERGRFVEHLAVKENGSERVKDAVWALMTCTEFRFNH